VLDFIRRTFFSRPAYLETLPHGWIAMIRVFLPRRGTKSCAVQRKRAREYKPCL
jgi:hypothetical protein